MVKLQKDEESLHTDSEMEQDRSSQMKIDIDFTKNGSPSKIKRNVTRFSEKSMASWLSNKLYNMDR